MAELSAESWASRAASLQLDLNRERRECARRGEEIRGLSARLAASEAQVARLTAFVLNSPAEL